MGEPSPPPLLVLPYGRTHWVSRMTPSSQGQNILARCLMCFWQTKPSPCAVTSCAHTLATTLEKKKVFNTLLSHVRRMVECAFGMLASQWRVYRRVLCVSPEVAENVVKATCMLHNFLRWDASTTIPARSSTGTSTAEPSQGLQNAPRLGTNNAGRDVVAVREKFAQYFMSEAGRVPWQDNI